MGKKLLAGTLLRAADTHPGAERGLLSWGRYVIYNTFLCGRLGMYNPATTKILDLLDAGEERKARALFMTHLAAHCRKIDAALGRVLQKRRYTNERLWQVFKGAYHLGWFN